VTRNAPDVTALPTQDVRILVENGEYPLLNRGDVAMLSITVQRLRERWPDARIGVLTDRPTLLRALVPHAEPVDGRRGGNWPADGWYRRILHVAGSRIIGPLSARGRAVAEEPWRRLLAIRGAVRAGVPLAGRHPHSNREIRNLARRHLTRAVGRLPHQPPDGRGEPRRPPDTRTRAGPVPDWES